VSIADDVLAALAPLCEADNRHAIAMRVRINLAADRDAETHRQLVQMAGQWQVLQSAISSLPAAEPAPARRTITVSYDPDDLPLERDGSWVHDFERELVSDEARHGKAWGVPITVDYAGPNGDDT
jgi:allophanate hydrolase subunit 1